MPSSHKDVQADCDWDGVMNRTDFLGVGQEILKNSCDQMDDVKAAFRVFDSNDNGSISKEELREAMVNLGQRCTEEYVVLLLVHLIFHLKVFIYDLTATGVKFLC